MKELEEKILKEGKIYPNNVLKVGSFLNHKIDVPFVMKMGREIAAQFGSERIDEVLTVESSGIAFAVCIASALNVPAVFAKKSKSSNVSNDLYQTQVMSYTHNVNNNVIVEKEFIKKDQKILIADDFLASGSAVEGLIDIVNQGGAKLVGVAAAVEKGFQGGGDKLRNKGVKVVSLAIIDSMSENDIKFRKQ